MPRQEAPPRLRRARRAIGRGKPWALRGATCWLLCSSADPLSSDLCAGSGARWQPWRAPAPRPRRSPKWGMGPHAAREDVRAVADASAECAAWFPERERARARALANALRQRQGTDMWRTCREGGAGGDEGAPGTLTGGASERRGRLGAEALARPLERAGIERAARAGYPIGLSYPPDWGERTISIRTEDKSILHPGMTFHFMPGLWMDDWGMEITESFMITDNGPAETFADFPRKLFIKK